MTRERIDIEQFDMHNEINVVSSYGYLELDDKYLLYAGKYSCDIPKSDTNDHSMGWKPSKQNFRIKIKKEYLISVEIRFNYDHNIWAVELEANGYPVTIKSYFQVGQEAKRIYDRLDKYIFGE